MMYKNTFISICMVAIIGLAAWTTLSYHPQEQSSLPAATLPDAYMEDVVALIMDKQGKPKIKIETPKMVHFTNNDISELTNPHLTVYRQSPQPWFITAKFARAKHGIDHVDFWEDVMIHHACDLMSPSTIIKTPKLTVHPNDQTAETDSNIILIQPNIVVKAIGMIANMADGNIKLLSQAQGEYVSDS